MLLRIDTRYASLASNVTAAPPLVENRSDSLVAWLCRVERSAVNCVYEEKSKGGGLRSQGDEARRVGERGEDNDA